MAKNLKVGVVLSLLSVQAIANDFRALDFGDLCENLIEEELKIGGKHNGDEKFSYFTGPFEYHSQLVSDNAKIVYVCDKENVFRKGKVFLNFDTAEELQAKSIETYEILEGSHGPPTKTFNGDAESELGVFIEWAHGAYKVIYHAHRYYVSGDKKWVNVLSLQFSSNSI